MEQYIEEMLVCLFRNDVVPIVMGARKEDYAAKAPPHSYIHVEDFPTPRELAQYIHILDKNNTLYNQYFGWKESGEFVNTKYWCRICALLNQKDMPRMWYSDIEEWWRGPGMCSSDRWDNDADLITRWRDIMLWHHHQHSIISSIIITSWWDIINIIITIIIIIIIIIIIFIIIIIAIVVIITIIIIIIIVIISSNNNINSLQYHCLLSTSCGILVPAF